MRVEDVSQSHGAKLGSKHGHLIGFTKEGKEEEREVNMPTVENHRMDQAMTEDMMQQKFFLSPLARWI